MSDKNNKLHNDRAQKQLLEIAALPGNSICADCKARNPRWASHNLGIFICIHCASIHRKIGTHITKVKSLTADVWTKDQVENMRAIGNNRSNSIYCPNELRYPPPPNLEDSERDSEIEQYIRSKYEYRKFIDRSALVASKLGPSRSASSITNTRSSTLPVVPRSPAPAAPPAAPTPPVSSQPRSTPSAVPPARAPDQSNHPVRSATLPAPPPPAPKSGGVWDDLSSLASAGQDSSLPLQYHAPVFTQAAQPQTPIVHGAMGTNGYPVGVTSAGMGMNPYQPQQLGLNPYSQQSTGSPFAPLPLSSSPGQGFGQQVYGTSTGQPASAAPFYQPTPQSSLQVQVPSGQNFLSHSPSQPFMSAPVTQTNFLTPSPSQQMLSHSPQPQMQQPTQTGYMYQAPMSAQLGGGMQNGTGQNGFLGMTTMQMQQQQLLLQQQQQQQQQQQLQQLQQLQQQQQLQQLQQQQGMYGAPQMQSQPTMTGMNGMGGMNMFGGGQMYAQGQPQWGAL